jgi:ABC-2 type transport system ATP-binding protein
LPLLEVKEVYMRYGAQEVLGGVSFLAERGTVTAIIGKNGCGKSTLLAIMAGRLRPAGGSVLLGGRDILKGGAPGGRVSCLPQGDILFGELSVRDNLNFWGRAAGISAGEAVKSRFVGMLGLGDFMKKKVRELSGGMRRRAAIAASLLGDPDLILLDEPFAGLDLIYREELKGFLLSMKEDGKTIIYTTHSPGELEGLSDRAALLAGGKIALQKPLAGLAGDTQSLSRLFLSYLRRDNND